MRWTTVFIFKLMQHTVVAVGSAQSAIPESRVILTGERGIKQRNAQHVLGQADDAGQAREVDIVPHRRHASRRINVGTQQVCMRCQLSVHIRAAASSAGATSRIGNALQSRSRSDVLALPSIT